MVSPENMCTHKDIAHAQKFQERRKPCEVLGSRPNGCVCNLPIKKINWAHVHACAEVSKTHITMLVWRYLGVVCLLISAHFVAWNVSVLTRHTRVLTNTPTCVHSCTYFIHTSTHLYIRQCACLLLMNNSEAILCFMQYWCFKAIILWTEQ